MLSVTSVMISKTLVSANYSTTVKYTKKHLFRRRRKIRKIGNEKF